MKRKVDFDSSSFVTTPGSRGSKKEDNDDDDDDDDDDDGERKRETRPIAIVACLQQSTDTHLNFVLKQSCLPTY